jgi:hypothetical protein
MGDLWYDNHIRECDLCKTSIPTSDMPNVTHPRTALYKPYTYTVSFTEPVETYVSKDTASSSTLHSVLGNNEHSFTGKQ